jgi:Domain of unknown function DUF29
MGKAQVNCRTSDVISVVSLCKHPKAMAVNWQELSFNSHYLTAQAVKEELAAGHIQEAEAGINELLDAMSRAEQRALSSQLTRLMMHIYKWRIQPEKRSASWTQSIRDARETIVEIREDTPSLNKLRIQSIWSRSAQRAWEAAHTEAFGEDVDSPAPLLTWGEVFDEQYRIPKREL